ncbi:MAG: hypothetical protein KF726_09530 [Anaerolineae bacterium]|nr:hypothetical protein [Anaerolineae bacterium]
MRFIGLILALFLSTLIGVTVAYAFGLTTSLDPDSFAAALARDTKLVEGMWCWRKICAEGTAFMEVPRLSRPELSWRIVNDIDATTRAW